MADLRGGFAEDNRPVDGDFGDVVARGLKTHHVLDAKQPFTVRYIMGVAGIPKNFDRVRDIVAGKDTVRLVSDSGQEVETPVNVGFVR